MTCEKPNIEGLKHAYGVAAKAYGDHSMISTGPMLPVQYADHSLEGTRLLKAVLRARAELDAALASNGGE